MNTLHLHFHRFSRALRRAHVLLFAMLVQALVPVGYMPAQAGAVGGPLPITVCTQGMPAGFHYDPADHGSDNTPSAMPHCVFSTVGALPALLPSVEFTLFSPQPVSRVSDSGTPLANGGTRCGPPVGPRAPPILLVS